MSTTVIRIPDAPQYDRNGRVRYVGHFAGGAAPGSCLDSSNRGGLPETGYQGDLTISIDPASKQRDLARDALGLLTAATEYTGGTPATYLTSYTYNALDNLHRIQTKSYTDGTPDVRYGYYLAGNAPRMGRLQPVTGSPDEGGFHGTSLSHSGESTMRYPPVPTLICGR